MHAEVLLKVLCELRRPFQIFGLIASPIKGPKGNIEFLVDLVLNETPQLSLNIEELIASALSGIPE